MTASEKGEAIFMGCGMHLMFLRSHEFIVASPRNGVRLKCILQVRISSGMKYGIGSRIVGLREMAISTLKLA